MVLAAHLPLLTENPSYHAHRQLAHSCIDYDLLVHSSLRTAANDRSSVDRATTLLPVPSRSASH